MYMQLFMRQRYHIKFCKKFREIFKKFTDHYKKLTILLFVSFYLQGYQDVNFYQSMNIKEYNFKSKFKPKTSNALNLIFLEKLYKKYNSSFKKIRIPKIIHQIWVGPKPIPESYKKFQQTWKYFHPDWIYKLWTDKDVKSIKLHNQNLYDRTKSYIEKADILRYELLEKFGGLYVDLDFECLKPFDKLHYRYDFYTGISHNNQGEIVNNAVIACHRNHPLIKAIIRNIKDEDIQDWRNRSGVFYFSQQFCKLIKIHKGINVALPMGFFYVIPYNFNQELSIKPFIQPETMALHYWGSNKFKFYKESNNKLEIIK